MRTIIAIVIGFFINLCYGHETSSEPHHHKQHPLFEVMNLISFKEVPMTPTEVLETSEVIVRGHIVSVTEGRIVENNNGYSRPINTALFKIEVSKVIKGDIGKFVYFEYIRGGLPAETMDKRKYTEDILFFLRQPTWDKATYTFHNSPNGLMNEVDTLYTLTTQRGLLIEEEAGGHKTIAQPLNHGDPLLPGNSFGDIEREIPTLESGESYGFDFKGINKDQMKK